MTIRLFIVVGISFLVASWVFADNVYLLPGVGFLTLAWLFRGLKEKAEPMEYEDLVYRYGLRPDGALCMEGKMQRLSKGVTVTWAAEFLGKPTHPGRGAYISETLRRYTDEAMESFGALPMSVLIVSRQVRIIILRVPVDEAEVSVNLYNESELKTRLSVIWKPFFAGWGLDSPQVLIYNAWSEITHAYIKRYSLGLREETEYKN